VALAAVVGLFLSREHRASRTLRLAKATPEQVWAVITDHARDPEWRGDVKATTRLADQDGHAVWKDEFRNGEAMSYATLEAVAPTRLVRRIVDSGGPFGGTWTYELRAEGAGCRLTITEDGWVSNPIFRTIGKLFIGHHATLEAYLKDLARRLGETAAPEAD
jgi:uncharacterized protein YndB with AHSA1/START domain